MKLRLLSLLGAAAFVFTACEEVDIVDGRIPAEYLEQARSIEGEYSGMMERQAVTLNLRLDGDRLVLNSDRDLIGEGCESVIGDLTKVRVDQEDGNTVVEGAKFDFDANMCAFNIEGRSLDFRIRNRNGVTEFNASILAYRDWREECRVECSPPNGGCRRICNHYPNDQYLNGRFRKVQ